ncbi:MAG TPA: hypothetical protein VGE37_02085 [Archangium sp.]
MTCPLCQAALNDPRWAHCSACRLSWVRDVEVIAHDGISPWPRDDRRVTVPRAVESLAAWYVLLPMSALGAAAFTLSIRNVLDGATWREWAAAAIGILLGGWVVSLFVQDLTRWILHLVLPEAVEVKAGVARVRLRGEAFRRSAVVFPLGSLTSVRLSVAQRDHRHVWLQHESGLHLLVGTMEPAVARSFVLRLTA